MMDYGFQRLVLLNSAGYERAELPLDASVSLVAPNNTGKTSLINALQFLLIIDRRRMDFGSYEVDRSRRFYFPSNSAYILLEVLLPDSGSVVLGCVGKGVKETCSRLGMPGLPVLEYHELRSRLRSYRHLESSGSSGKRFKHSSDEGHSLTTTLAWLNAARLALARVIAAELRKRLDEVDSDHLQRFTAHQRSLFAVAHQALSASVDELAQELLSPLAEERALYRLAARLLEKVQALALRIQRLFFCLAINPHELRGVADVLAGLGIFIDENFQHAGITTHTWVGAFAEQVTDQRLTLLAVAVNTAVALLEDHQRPGDVEVDHPVAEMVQVDTFRGDIRADQQAQRTALLVEGLNGGCKLTVWHITTQHANLAGFERAVARQVVLEELEGTDALGEDHQAIVILLAPAKAVCAFACEQLTQTLILAELRDVDRLDRRQQAVEGIDILAHTWLLKVLL